jgi:hypothetical protein
MSKESRQIALDVFGEDETLDLVKAGIFKFANTHYRWVVKDGSYLAICAVFTGEGSTVPYYYAPIQAREEIEMEERNYHQYLVSATEEANRFAVLRANKKYQITNPDEMMRGINA